MKYTSPTALRTSLRAQRKGLSPEIQQQSALAVTHQVIQSSFFHSAQRIAAYLPTEGELNPQLILEAAWQANKQVFLPRLNRVEKTLQFYLCESLDNLSENEWGILEPPQNSALVINPQQLDVVFVPLVAFDQAGTRLGRGQGYYDRTFSFKRELLTSSVSQEASPCLVGLAYAFQEVNRLERQPWDVGLDVIITDQHLFELSDCK
jgi:5-formyltetrahydrofolate cyclo-ligase